MAGRDPHRIEAVAVPRAGAAGAVRGQAAGATHGAVDEGDGSSLAHAHAVCCAQADRTAWR